MAKTPVEEFIEQQKNISKEVPQEFITVVYIKDGTTFRPLNVSDLAGQLPENVVTIQTTSGTVALYNVQHQYEYDNDGNLIYEYIIGRDANGTLRTFKRQYIYDNSGNLIKITNWIEV